MQITYYHQSNSITDQDLTRVGYVMRFSTVQESVKRLLIVLISAQY